MPKKKYGTLRGGAIDEFTPPPPTPEVQLPNLAEWRMRRRANEAALRERLAQERAINRGDRARGGGAEPLFADMLGSGVEFQDLQGEGLSEWIGNLGKLLKLLKIRANMVGSGTDMDSVPSSGGGLDYVGSGAEFEDLQGEGIFDWVKNLVKVVRNPTQALQSMPKPIADFNAIYDNYSIVSIYICREPLSSGLQSVIDRASQGQLLKNLKDSPYEALYHLFANVYLRDDKTGKTKSFRIEKNQRIEVIDRIVPPKGGNLGKCMGVPNIPPKLLWSKFWQGANADTFQYSANKNNCQAFLKTRLEALGLLTPELKEFIMQPIDELIPGAEVQKSIAKNITNAASILQNIWRGGEYDEPTFLRGVKTPLR